jgi:hypothetical protein
MTARCECCDLPVASCGKAAETKQRREDQRQRMQLRVRLMAAGWLLSRYPGFCVRCGEPYPEGTLIQRRTDPRCPDGPCGWVAECCGDLVR